MQSKPCVCSKSLVFVCSQSPVCAVRALCVYVVKAQCKQSEPPFIQSCRKMCVFRSLCVLSLVSAVKALSVQSESCLRSQYHMYVVRGLHIRQKLCISQSLVCVVRALCVQPEPYEEPDFHV